MFSCKKSLHLMVLAIFCYTQLSAQEHSHKKSILHHSTPVYFSGQVTGPIEAGDTIALIFKRDYLYHLTNATIVKIHPDINGFFKCQFPAINHPALLQLGIYYKRRYFNLGDFIVDRRDSIKIQVASNKSAPEFSARFSGRGYEKYNCRMELDAVNDTLELNREKNLINTLADIPASRTIFLQGQYAMLRILNNYKSKIPASVLRIMKAQYVSPIPIVWILEMKNCFAMAKTAVDSAIVREAMKNYAYPTDNGNETDLALAPNYVSFLLLRQQAMMIYSHPNGRYSYKSLYHYLKTNFTGALRDKLLMMLLLFPQNTHQFCDFEQNVFDTCLKDAIQIVKTADVRLALTNTLLYCKGTPVGNYSFVDMSGKVRTLASLIGKVVLLDVWFTSCGGCRKFADTLHNKIYPAFYKDTSFCILSICTNTDRNVWLKSIEQGIYTQASFTNVYTGGLDFYDHPLIKHYNVQGAPWILLIDKKGKVVSRITLNDDSRSIRALILDALQQ